MFAVVANGIQTICRTQRQLDNIIAIYPYPKFVKCKDENSARAWLREHARGNYKYEYNRYGDTATRGFVEVNYEIKNNNIYGTIVTKYIGFIRIDSDDCNVSISNSRENIQVIIKNIVLNNQLIAHHIIAMRYLLKLLGDFVDVDFIVPDMSVFLAATKYTGTNYIIRGFQKDTYQRLGGVSFSVRRGVKNNEDVDI